MIFEKEEISFKLLEVLKLEQTDVNTVNVGRNFDALSFRYRADTRLETADKVVSLGDDSVCFVPANIDYTRKSAYDELIVIHFNALDYFSKSIEFFYPENRTEIAELFEQILDCWNEKKKGYKHRCSSILYRIFAKFCEEFSIETVIDSKIEKAVRYIKNNYTSPDLSVKKAAEESSISEVYFRKLFRKEFGTSPKKYIIDARIKHAVNLIESGYYSLSQVAEMCGFDDYKYFSTQFHRAKGVPPSKYFYNYEEKV